MTIRIGTQVRESETDPNWQMYPGETGVVVARADEEMGFSPGEAGFGRFWMVRFVDDAGTFEDGVFMDTDLVKVS